MKLKRIALFFFLSTVTIVSISCSNTSNFTGDEEKVKNLVIQAYNYPSGTMTITHVKLLSNITVQDSINYYLKYSDEIIHDHNEAVKKFDFWVGQKGSKSYSDYDIESEIKRWTDELNRYADAYEGKEVSESWAHEYVYRKLYEFRQMDEDKVLGKIYTITYTIKGSKPHTDIRSFDADITKAIASYSYIEAVNVPAEQNLEKIHFSRIGSNIVKEDKPQEATFIKEGNDIKEFDENGDPIEQ